MIRYAAIQLQLRLRREHAQTMAEYAVILGVISVVVVAALVLLAGGIGDAIDRVTDVIVGGDDTSTP